MISADRGTECPVCGDTLPPGRKRCDCGARLDKSTKGSKDPIWEPCDYCGQSHRWYRVKSENGANDPQRLIGRSVAGGYVCLPCDQRRSDPEFNWIDAKMQHIAEDQGPIGSMIRASRGAMSDEDRSQVLQFARSAIRKLSARTTPRITQDHAA